MTIHLSHQQIQKLSVMLAQASQLAQSMYFEYVNNGTDIDVQHKQDNSPVTQADMAVHNFITQQIKTITPEWLCLSEELDDKTQRHQHEVLWLLDPIDGTKAFIGKTDDFTINLTLVHNDSAVASWLVVPTEQLMYCGFADSCILEIDEVVVSNTVQTGKVYQASVQNPNDWQEIDFLANNTSNNEQDTGCDTGIRLALSPSAKMQTIQPFIDALEQDFQTKVTVTKAASAYKFVQMLRGDIDVYVRLQPTCEWDTASGQGMLELGGGWLCTLAGKEFTYNQRKTLLNAGFVCATARLDKQKIMRACQSFNVEA